MEKYSVYGSLVAKPGHQMRKRPILYMSLLIS